MFLHSFPLFKKSGVDLAAHVLALRYSGIVLCVPVAVVVLPSDVGAQVHFAGSAQGGVACALVADLCGGQVQVSPGVGQQYACGTGNVQHSHAVDAGLGKAVVACAVGAVVLLQSATQDRSPFFGASSEFSFFS